MKITVACFGNISSKKERSALAYYNYELISDLYTRGLLDKVYCLDYDETVTIPASQIKKFSGTFFSRINALISKFSKSISSIPDRYIMERAFDRFVYWNENFNNSTLLLNIKGINLALYRKAKKKNIPIAIIADVCHPEFIYDQVKKLENKYMVTDNSPYTNRLRINNLTASFSEANLVIPKFGADIIINSYLHYGFKTSDIGVLKYISGIDCSTFIQKNQEIDEKSPVTFFTINQSGLKKGYLLLRDAWSNLDEDVQKKAILKIAGSLDKSSESYANQHFSNLNVDYIGYTSKVFESYQEANVFVAASVEDLGPRAVLEAMASGLPVIVSSHCGLAQWVEDGVDGFTYDPFNVESLSKILAYFIQNPAKIKTMGANARKKAESFTYQKYNDDLLHVLEVFNNN